MAGMHGVALPNGIAVHLGAVRPWLQSAGVSFVIGGGGELLQNVLWVAALMGIALVMPNTFELFVSYKPAFETRFAGAGDAIRPFGRRLQGLRWSPTRGWASAIATLLLLGLMALGRISEFLYFQF